MDGQDYVSAHPANINFRVLRVSHYIGESDGNEA